VQGEKKLRRREAFRFGGGKGDRTAEQIGEGAEKALVYGADKSQTKRGKSNSLK